MRRCKMLQMVIDELNLTFCSRHFVTINGWLQALSALNHRISNRWNLYRIEEGAILQIWVRYFTRFFISKMKSWKRFAAGPKSLTNLNNLRFFERNGKKDHRKYEVGTCLPAICDGDVLWCEEGAKIDLTCLLRIYFSNR